MFLPLFSSCLNSVKKLEIGDLSSDRLLDGKLEIHYLELLNSFFGCGLDLGIAVENWYFPLQQI